MKNKNLLSMLFLLMFSILVLLSAAKRDQQNSNLAKTATNDHYEYIAINQCLMYVSNNGEGSHNPNTDGSGFY